MKCNTCLFYDEIYSVEENRTENFCEARSIVNFLKKNECELYQCEFSAEDKCELYKYVICSMFKRG